MAMPTTSTTSDNGQDGSAEMESADGPIRTDGSGRR